MKLVIYDRDNQRVEINSSKIKTSSYMENTSNTTFDIGCAISTSYDLSIFNIDNEFSNIRFEDNKFTLYNDNGDEMGYFNIVRTSQKGAIIKIETLDNMHKLKEEWKGMPFPTTVWELTLNCCNQCGVSLGTTKDEMINANITIQSPEDLKGHTCKEIIAEIAKINGGYAIMGRNGRLYFKNYDLENVDFEFTTSNVSGLTIEEIDTIRQGVVIVNEEKEYPFGDTNNAFVIDNSPLCKYMSKNDIYICGNNIFSKIKNLVFRACKFNTEYEYGYKAGATATFKDKDNVIHKLIFTQLKIKNNQNAYIDCFGDEKNRGNTNTYSTFKNNSSSSKNGGNSKAIEDWGRVENHQLIDSKSGQYTIVEAMVKGINYYTKVDLQFTANFSYNNGNNNNEILTFDVYANDMRLPQRFPVMTHDGINQISFSFLADLPESEECIYSVKVTIEDGCRLIINPFQSILTLMVLEGSIDCENATDQYFIERVSGFEYSLLNQNRVTLKNIYEDISFEIPRYLFDVSKNSDGSVMAEWYEDGTLKIKGIGQIKDDEIYDIAFWTYDSEALSNVKEKTTKIEISEGVTSIGDTFFKDMAAIEEVKLPKTNTISIGTSAFENCIALTTITNETNIVGLEGSVFKNTALTGTYDFTNCESFGGEVFSNSNQINYISFAKDIQISDTTFKDSYFDSVLVLNANSGGFFGDEFNFSSNTFKNCCISTFILAPEVEIFDCDGGFDVGSGFANVNTSPKTFYVCASYSHDSDIGRIRNWGFDVVVYRTEEYEDLLNEVWH